ncbi:MAG: hypothetical protein GY796_34900 [Chloroflexi bacterium]|nr:hypothetical protein [Chloroflexota bacterium]
MKHLLKNKNHWWLIAAIGALAITAAVVFAGSSPRFGVPWWTVDGGGGESGGGSQRFHVAGTIGQPDAGAVTSSSSTYTFSGGFWEGYDLLAAPTPTPTPTATPTPTDSEVYLPVIQKPIPCFNDGPERNPNNSTAEADANGLLCDGVTITGLFDDQSDYFAMQTGTNGLIDITLTGYTGNDAQILLLYQGNLVAQGVTPDYHIQHTGPAGQYHIRVFIPAANNANYSLNVNFP